MIPTPVQLQKILPLEPHHKAFVESARQTIRNILSGKEKRMIIVVGPCSIHDVEATYAYAEKLKRLSQEVADRFFIVMRTYFEKPRTLRGWKGFLSDPDLDGSYNLSKGLFLSRKILLDLATLELPAASEFLDINTTHFLSDLLSWGCIGARTCTSQPHRQLAASLPLPIGFKNSTDGNVLHAIHGMLSASSPHVFLGLTPQGNLSRICTSGNPYTHLVLRGAETRPNYDAASLADAIHQCHKNHVSQNIFVDCSHGNSGKCAANQRTVFRSILEQNNPSVVGMMLESHLLGGSQPPTTPHPHISITDPCLSWDETEELICGALAIK